MLRPLDDEGVVAQLVEEDRMGERADGAAPPVIDDLDDAIEVGLGDAADVHGCRREGRLSPLSKRGAQPKRVDAPLDGGSRVRHLVRATESP